MKAEQQAPGNAVHVSCKISYTNKVIHYFTELYCHALIWYNSNCAASILR